jgi:anaerobic ribonucleoside-triphosphate reductase
MEVLNMKIKSIEKKYINNNEYWNSFGAGKSKIGSLGVCTINLAKLSFKTKTKDKFLNELKTLVEVCARLNNAKRHIIKDRILKGFLPLYSLDFMDINTQYSTTGLNGIYEAVSILGEDILQPNGQQIVVDMLDVINKENDKYQTKFDAPHNVEQVPAESCFPYETKVKTLDGDIPIGELVGKEPTVFSFKPGKGIILTKAKNVRKTKLNQEIFRVWFDNNTYVDCTENHRFAKNTYNNDVPLEWIACKDLKKGDSIRSVYKTENDRIRYNGVKEEHIVYRYFFGEIPEHCVIHHKDNNKKNNNKENLECLTKSKHTSIHSLLHNDEYCKCCICKAKKGEMSGKNNPFYGKHHTEETKKNNKIKISSTMKKLVTLGKLFTPKHRENLSISCSNKTMEQTSRFNKNINTNDIIENYHLGLTYKQMAKKFNCTTGTIQSRLKVNGLNHKIMNVEKLNIKKDVYDLEVPETNCFFVNDGILVHNSGIKLAEKDKLLGFNTKYPLYSNQFIPLVINGNMLDRINLQGKFDKMFSGGAICHINIEQEIMDYKKIMQIIEYSAKKGVIYWAINYNLQQCENSHMSVGKKETCSICNGRITDNYLRVVGFLTNTKNWNPVRREIDYPNRKWYKSDKKEVSI